MNYTESFQEFSSKLSPTDLMVYAGAALVIFVLFKDQFVGLKSKLLELYTNLVTKTTSNKPIVSTSPVKANDNDFLKLISSWKNTRNLAQSMGCEEAVKILDSAFPHLGPHDCTTDKGNLT
jgi:hypothetical protein